MTKLPTKLKKIFKSTPETLRLPKYSLNLKNDWNTSATKIPPKLWKKKMSEIPPKPKKNDQIPWNLKNYWNTPKT